MPTQELNCGKPRFLTKNIIITPKIYIPCCCAAAIKFNFSVVIINVLFFLESEILFKRS